MARPANSPNKPRAQMLSLLERRFPNWNPVVQMAERANDPAVDPADRFLAAKEVAQYLVPKLKAVEVTGPDGGALSIEVIIAPHAQATRQD